MSQNKIVLFIGTPCQVGGLLGFLKGRKDNLYTIEILCHGVPNQRMFKEHIELIEKKHKQNITSYSFRCKTFAWWTHGIAKACIDNKKYISSYDIQSFLYFFQNNLSLRKSCFSCPYKDVKRGADITIGDDWDSVGSKKDYVNGLSLLTVNSPKGEILFNLIKQHMNVNSIKVNRVNKTVSNATHFPKKRYDEFWEMYCQSGYQGVENKFFPKDIKSITKFYIKRDKAQLESVWFRRRR